MYARNKMWTTPYSRRWPILLSVFSCFLIAVNDGGGSWVFSLLTLYSAASIIACVHMLTQYPIQLQFVILFHLEISYENISRKQRNITLTWKF